MGEVRQGDKSSSNMLEIEYVGDWRRARRIGSKHQRVKTAAKWRKEEKKKATG